MNKIVPGFLCAMALLGSARPTAALDIFLDADTPATGSDLDVSPLVTGAGTITFTGEIRDRNGDDEFNAAGASGDVFDIDNGSATFAFNFDVSSISFIYGGNSGVFSIEALDAGLNVVDSFFQANTDAGQPAGPISLSGAGIRSLVWTDPGGNFAPIDNVTIRTDALVPDGGSSMALLGLALGSLLGLRRKARAGR